MAREDHRGASPPSSPSAASRVRYCIFLASVVVVVFAAFELFLQFLLSHPRAIPSGLLDRVRAYYSWNLREIVQFKPECAQYDDTLFYTLRPGRCRFSSPEFDTAMAVNSRGLRDEESALQAPEIIVVGDSFAMGWGVAQEETFPERIEALTGKKTLNAGIPSYGTAREMILYASLDRSKLRYLVIQYCENDLGENVRFQRFQNRLPISSRESYEELTELSRQSSRYYPGKHTAVMLPVLLGRQQQSRLLSTLLQDEEAPSADPFQPPETFLNVLFSFSRELAGVKIIVLHVPPRGQIDNSLIKPLQELKAAYPTNPIFSEMAIVDLAGILKVEDYFVLDDHVRKQGHDAIARAVLPHLTAPAVK